MLLSFWNSPTEIQLSEKKKEDEKTKSIAKSSTRDNGHAITINSSDINVHELMFNQTNK